MTVNHRPDLDGLREFVWDRDRDQARFFVGRGPVIRDIGNVCATVRKGRFASATFLIQGAPGAGKTALLRRLQELWTGPDAPHAVLCHIDTVSTPAKLVRVIVDAVAPHLADEFRSISSVEAGGGFSLFGFSLTARRSKGGTPPADDPWAWLRERLPPQDWQRPLCLMVDEIQNLKEPGAGPLQALHQGAPDLPIMPVLAGLAHSRDVLGRCGISRLSDDAVQTLGALETGEPSAAVRLMLDRFGIDAAGADIDRWADLIEACSDRWPQHLQNGMRSLAEGLIEANGVLARVDGEVVTARERQRRLRAYRARRSREIESSRFLVAGIMTGIGGDGRPRGEVIDLVREIARPDDVTDWQLPSGMNAEDFVDHLIARGALQPNDDGLLACPIPSFRGFLTDCGRHASR